MSWATLVEEGCIVNNQIVVDSTGFESEEAILHGLRSDYNTAMETVGSNPVGSMDWTQALNRLEKVALDCSLYSERIPSAKVQLQEIAYLAKRNRVQCYSKDRNSDSNMCYPLILESLSIMMELGKEDMSMVLLAARYAKLMNDTWTYKQLILFHQASLPYMYKDLILADFEATINQIDLVDNSVEMGNNLVGVNSRDSTAAHSRLSWDSHLATNATDQFMSFVAQKILQGSSLSMHTAWSGFNADWLASADVTLREVEHLPVSAAEYTTVVSGVEVNTASSSPADNEIPDKNTEMVVDSEVGTGDFPQVDETAVMVGAEDTVGDKEVDGAGRSRRSGRATKKTDPGAWEENRALQAAIEASKSMSRVPSQSQLSRGTSGSEDASNVTDIKKLLIKAEGSKQWDSLLQDGGEGLLALHCSFPLPITLLEKQSQLAHTAHRVSSQDSIDNGASDHKDASAEAPAYCSTRTAELFQTYLHLVNGDGALSDLIHLHIKFIEVLAYPSGFRNSVSYLFEEFDCAALLSWRALTDAVQGDSAALFVRLSAEEELLLLECALSLVLRCLTGRGEGRTDPLSVHPEASAILRRLIPALFGRLDGGEFWMRFNNDNMQLRALWSSVLISRHFGVDDLGDACSSDSTSVSLLTTMLQKLAPMRPGFSSWLPHMHDETRCIISLTVCQDLLSGIQYEAEVRDLVSSYEATKPWVQDVLAQIRLGDRLQSLLGFQQTTSYIDGSFGATDEAGASHSIPLLLLEACRKLKDVALWLDVVSAVLEAAVFSAHSSTGMISGSWMNDILLNMVSKSMPTVLHSSDVNDFPGDHIESILQNIGVLIYVNGAGSHSTVEMQSIVLQCTRLYDEVVLLGDNLPSQISFVHAFVHVLTHQSQLSLAGNGGTDRALLLALWCKFDALVISGAVRLSRMSAPAWSCLTRLTVDVWEAEDRTMSRAFREAVLSVFMNLVVSSPTLSVGNKGEIFVQCHFEILDNSLHEHTPCASTAGTKRKRALGGSRVPPTPEPPSRLPCMLRRVLEELVFDADFETNFVQRVQREITFVLGQVYYYCFGFPMVPLDSSGSDDEDSAGAEASKLLYDSNDATLVSTLYRYCKVCIKGGWVNKAEIRASLSMLAEADAFKCASSFATTKVILKHIFCSQDSLVNDPHALLSALQATIPPIGESLNDRDALVQSVGAELFFTLLQLGLPPSEVRNVRETANVESTTTLAAVCDLGLFLTDSNQGAVVRLCLMDLACNPFRYFSWNTLLRQYMEAFNAVMDELQKLLLPCRVPSACYDGAPLEYLDLIRPPLPGSDAVCLWTPLAAIPCSSHADLLDSACAALQMATGTDLATAFSDSVASETFFNLHRTADPPDYETHLQKLAHLIAIRNATFLVYKRMGELVEIALRTEKLSMSAAGDDKTMAHWQAEMAVLVHNNAAKCYPKNVIERIILTTSSLPLLQQDNFFDDDLYALATTAKLQWQLAKCSAHANDARAPTRLVALHTCGRVAHLLRDAKSYSKPVRVCALYQVSSICLKGTLLLIQNLASTAAGKKCSAELRVEHAQELTLIEECMATLLPAKASKSTQIGQDIADSPEEGTSAPQVLSPTDSRVWDALALTFAGLKECRRLDAFDFKSVYRVARGLKHLSQILSCADVAFMPTEIRTSLSDLLGARDISAGSALEELSKVFDRKRSQIVAMWCVEHAVSPWEKTLVRISQFDPQREKFIDLYLRLAVERYNVEVVLDVIVFAFSALKHATAVVLHALSAGVDALHKIVLVLMADSSFVDSASGFKADGASEAELGGSEDLQTKREALRADATRWLHVVFELFYQVRGFVSPHTLVMLEEIALSLYSHSDIYVAQVRCRGSPIESLGVVEETGANAHCENAGPKETLDLAAAEQQSATDPRNRLDDAENLPPRVVILLPTAEEVLGLCAAKWGRPKQPRSDLGKRAKGYFTVRNAPTVATAIVDDLRDRNGVEMSDDADAAAGVNYVSEGLDGVATIIPIVASTLVSDCEIVDNGASGGREMDDHLRATKVARLEH